MIFSLLTALALAGCGIRPVLQSFPSNTAIPFDEGSVSTPVVEMVEQQETPQNEAVNAKHVVIWLPPEFNPSETKSGSLLQQRISAFVQNHPGVDIELRVKETDGPTGMITALEKTLKIAPQAAPSLVLLPDGDLGTAAMRNLIQPQSYFQSILKDDDWYDYARELSLFQNNYYGVPFAADAMILAIRSPNKKPLTANWDSIISTAQPLLFPAADKNAAFTINLYLSAGGVLFDKQNKPQLEAETLEKVLQFYASSYSAGYIFPTIMDYAEDQQVWSAFEEKQADLVICRLSNYFSQNEPDVIGMTIPPLENEPVTLVNGWVWTLADPYQERMELDQELLQYLTEPDFQAELAFATGYLPVRPSSLSQWSDPARTALISQATISAIREPSKDLLGLFGPALNKAVYNVITQKTLPSEAAQAASLDINPD